MIEYVALGDYQTAVGFLLASEPEQSSRYYRDALCTLALANAAMTAGAAPDGAGGGGSGGRVVSPDTVSGSLLIQAAKVRKMISAAQHPEKMTPYQVGAQSFCPTPSCLKKPWHHARRLSSLGRDGAFSV